MHNHCLQERDFTLWLAALHMPESITSEAKSKLWRINVIRHLRASGFDSAANDFEQCGRASKVDYCRTDISHEPKVLKFTCKKRFCQECEKREAARKLRRYLAPLQELSQLNIPGHELAHLVLTTPLPLLSLSSEKFVHMWDCVRNFIQRLFFELFTLNQTITPSEARRGRVKLRDHNIGILAAAEFGEKGNKLHFHFIMYTPFIPSSLITRIWRESTDYLCKVVFIRLLDDSDLVKAIQEVAKYVTKFQHLNPAHVPHLMTVLKGVRRFRSYGLLYALKVEKTAPCGCAVCGGERVQLHVMDYLEACSIRGVLPDDEILNAFDPLHSVHLIHGNKSGVTYSENIRGPDHPPPKYTGRVER